MALSDDEKWILAENLKRQEREDIAKVERGQDGSSGDFGSYYALLTGKNSEWVKAHAISDADYLASYARQLRGLIGKFEGKKIELLDVGCGPGRLTQALAEGLGGGRASGIDISESGIAYARKTYPDCRFDVVSVDEGMDLGRKFDVVHAREFYPFTRTGDLEFHRKYVEVLAKHVAPGGVLALFLVTSPKSLAVNADALAPALKAAGMTPFRRATLAHARIPAFVPSGLARCATAAGRRLAGRPATVFYLSERA